MSVFSNRPIEQIYVGNTELKSIWVGKKKYYEHGVKPEPYAPNEYLYFKLCSSLSANISINEQWEGHKTGGTTEITYDKTQLSKWNTPTFEYSFNKTQWFTYTLGNQITLSNNGNRIVYFRGNNTAPWFDTYTTTYQETENEVTMTYTHYHMIHMQFAIADGKVKSGGNLLSLRDKTLSNITTIPCDYCFTGLFMNCSNLLTPPVLSATDLKIGCYGGYYFPEDNNLWNPWHYGMFENCTSLGLAPELPATTLKDYCYCGMFANCQALQKVPALPATTLAIGCYCYGRVANNGGLDLGGSLDHGILGVGMFENCTSIESPPELPATILKDYCYARMFCGCEQLKETLSLGATTMATGCYAEMFRKCSKLENITTLPATTLANYCYLSMFNGTYINKTIKLAATTMKEGCYEHMFESTSIITPPTLPAATLADYCYAYMFKNCFYLTTVPTLSATSVPDSAYAHMFSNCNKIETTPSLPATSLGDTCYYCMFQYCSNLKSISKLPATAFGDASGCYAYMFSGSSVRASTSSTDTYSYAYRVPTSGTATGSYITERPKYFGYKVTENMFRDDSYADFTPTVNTTFYLNVPSF